ncbi:hypothetical protein Swol_1312 [Syntrophomonas wolfei subsp. wolfei str. Goettingen G311]|uniref:Uncharacterized protein n=1 Tax=Syntrophomonas wolfei subsp. wolfei (strain DSM 2245B / Goettingen) TaxID=335541 RepID=Q0AXD4_SYNWW|nr:hypothetical protein Swol_1312 [Syntrophomonas wolfei subsp. wolfei str. Goettingen G311]
MQNVLQKNIKDEFARIVERNLSIGMAVKNYKIMCDLLDEEVKDGNRNRKFQMEKWKRYFDFKKVGHKFIILEIYDQPLEKTDKRAKGNNKEYIQHIELLLLSYLSKQKGYRASFTVKKLFLMLSMINQNYIDKNYKEIKENSITDVTNYDINHFYQRSYQKLKEILFGSLRNLENRRLIDYTENTVINIREIVDGKLIQNNRRLATDDEKNYIRDTQRQVLKEMGLEIITQVYLKFKAKEYFDRVNELLWERYGIHYSYTEIDILFTHKYIVEALEEAEILAQEKKLNDKVINYMNKQAKNNYEKNQQEYKREYEKLIDSWIGEVSPIEVENLNLFQLQDTYLDAQMELAEILIRV